MHIGLVGLAHKAKFLMSDNSSTILSGVAVAGTVTTAYLTGRATFKAAKIIDQEKKIESEAVSSENSEKVDLDLTLPTKVRLVWRHYIPPFVTGVTTITCIVAANRIGAKKIAALAVSSAISERALQEYKAKVVQKLGPKQDVAIRDEIAQDRVLNQPVRSGEVIIAGAGEVLFYDMTTGRYFQSTVEEVKKAVNKVNHELNNFMYASLSSFYEELDVPPTTYSDLVGWNANQQMDVKFSTVLSSDNRPCIAIDFEPAPFVEYDRLYDH
jgi:Family of unknown function (DUF6353)